MFINKGAITMNTYNNNSEVTVKDSLIGEGEKFEIRMNKFTKIAYLISVALSLSIPYLFLDWFYKWQLWPKIKTIKNLITSNYIIKYSLEFPITTGKWQYINFNYIYHHNHYNFYSSIMLVLYFYIVSVILLLMIK